MPSPDSLSVGTSWGMARGQGHPGILAAGCCSRPGEFLAVGYSVPSPSACHPLGILSPRPREAPARRVLWGGSAVGSTLRLGHPAAARGPEGPGSLCQVSENTAQTQDPQKTPAWVMEGTLSWARAGTALPGLQRAPAGHPGPRWARAGPLRVRQPSPLPTGPGRQQACPTVSMGDDFQGEISSSDESLSFTAAHKMSSPPGSTRWAALPSHLNLLHFPSLTPV